MLVNHFSMKENSMNISGRPKARIFFIIVLAFLLANCDRTPPEQALRNRIDALQQAIESREGADVRDALAEDFIGPDGLDRDDARRLAQGLFLRNEKVGVVLGPLDVEMQPDHATVRCTAVLTGGAGGLLPDNGDLYDLTTGWRLEDGDWLLTSIDWSSH